MHYRTDGSAVRTPDPDARASLALLTETHAGRFVAIDGVPFTVGRAADADLVLDDSGVSGHHLRVLRTPSGAFYAEDLESTNGTFLGTGRIGVALLRAGDLLKLGPNLQVRFATGADDPSPGRPCAVKAQIHEPLDRLFDDVSTHDPLTRVFNRQYFNDRLCAEIARSRRSGGEVAVLMIAVDGLREISDRFGHLAEKRALCTIAARILRAVRADDVLARHGGDAFVVLAVGTPDGDATELGERVRCAVEGLRMTAHGVNVRIAANIGLASLAEIEASDEPEDALLSLARLRMHSD